MPTPSRGFFLSLATFSGIVFALPAVASHHAPARSHTVHAASRHTASTHAVRGHGHYAAHAVAVRHDVAPSMDPERATAIQSALIRAGYLTGEPSGVWDASSVAAMQKLQDENGWQTKFTPDSRALAKLGLGAGPLPPTPPTGTPVATELTPPAPPAQP